MRTQRFSEIPLCNAETVEEPPDLSMPGTEILGKYTVVRKLGQGGMGVVVAARHNELGGLRAIKFLLPGTELDRQTVERFIREARASSRLRGEHIVRVHDAGHLENGAPFMVMEYLEGQNLKTILRNGALALGDAVNYLLQICDAMAEAHEAGIVHRDLKPANLYLTKRPNKTPCIKVLDFGISKLMDAEGTDLTGDHMIGSLRYMSPEQIKASKSVDARSDIWAMGLIACEFFAAKLPFGGQTQFDIVTNILEAEPEPPSTWRTDLPPSIEAIVLRCLRKNPKDRFQSVHELSGALQAAAGIPVRNAVLVRNEMSSISGGTATMSLPDNEPTKLDLSVTDNSPTLHLRPTNRARGVIAATAVVTLVVGTAGTIVWQNWRNWPLSEDRRTEAAQSESNVTTASSAAVPLETTEAPSASVAPPSVAPAANSSGESENPPHVASTTPQPTATPKAVIVPPPNQTNSAKASGTSPAKPKKSNLDFDYEH